MARKLDSLSEKNDPVTYLAPIKEGASGKKQILSLLLAGFYAVFVIGCAIFAATFLYDWSRGYFQGSAAPDLLPVVASAPGSQGQAHGTDGEAPISQPATEDHRAAPATGLDGPTGDRVNVLLLGIDEREDEDGPARTDTMMVISLDAAHRSVGMISLPRDLWVPIPGYDITTKINTAHVIGEHRGYPGGGPQLAKDTVGSFLGRPIHYYVRVNFDGFVGLIDQIDGIDLHVPETIHDEAYPTPDYGYETFHLEAGDQHLDGATALKYVRTRNHDSDYGRAQRQQQVIESVMDKVISRDMIPMLVARAPGLTSTMRDSFQTDMPISVAMEIAGYVHRHSFGDVRRLVLDNSYGEEGYSDDGSWILLPDRVRIRPALHDFFERPVDAALTDVRVTSNQDLVSAIAAQASDPEPRGGERVTDPGAVRLEILNGTGYPGVGARLGDQLAAQGWRVVAVGDADRSDYRRTLIVNYHVDEDLLDRLNGDIALQPELPTLNGLIISDTVDMRIIVGQDYLKDVLDLAN